MDVIIFIMTVGLILFVALLVKHTNERVSIDERKPTLVNNRFKGKTSLETDSVFKNVISFLNDEVYFRYGKNKVEKDYQHDLDQRFAVLKERFGYDIIYEAKNGKHRVDFVINDKIGIEMKVHKGGTQVKKELFYQITEYGKLYPKMIGLVLNDSDMDNQELKNEIETKLREQKVLSKEDYEIIVKTVGTTGRPRPYY
jgi:hypothetical protein